MYYLLIKIHLLMVLTATLHALHVERKTKNLGESDFLAIPIVMIFLSEFYWIGVLSFGTVPWLWQQFIKERSVKRDMS